MNSKASASSDKNISASGSGSSPDLRTLSSQAEDQFVSYRKRKQPECDIQQQLSTFQLKMSSDLKNSFKEFSQEQNQNIEKLCSEFANMKSDLIAIKSFTEAIILDNKNIREELNIVKQQNKEFQRKIEILENKFDLTSEPIENVQNQHLIQPPCEDLASELFDRTLRAKNLVIVGILEISNNDTSQMLEHDRKEVLNVLRNIYPDCPQPSKTYRLGRHNPGKVRPIKVCFESDIAPKHILRNKSILKNDKLRIYSDQTPMQRQHILELRKELSKRIENGETNLKIKYFKGMPKIIKSNQKNSNA